MSLKVIRNWLNLIFIIGAAIGMYVFYRTLEEAHYTSYSLPA